MYTHFAQSPTFLNCNSISPELGRSVGRPEFWKLLFDSSHWKFPGIQVGIFHPMERAQCYLRVCSGENQTRGDTAKIPDFAHTWHKRLACCINRYQMDIFAGGHLNLEGIKYFDLPFLSSPDPTYALCQV